MVEVYINLNGKAHEAMKYYEEVFGGSISNVQFTDDSEIDFGMPKGQNTVLHATMKIKDSNVNFSDLDTEAKVGTQISLVVRCDSDDEVVKLTNKLAEGGKVRMAAEPSFFASMYGDVIDKYGVIWQLIHGQTT